MNEQEIASNMTFWMWVLSGISGVITTLIGIIFYFTHSKIDGAYARIDSHEEEVKGEMMKNDRDHREFWQQFKEAAKDRESHCISRTEYEKDIKHTADSITEMKGFMKDMSENMKTMSNLIIKHMAKDS